MNKYLLFKALCHLPKAIYFNFHYLPFHQAIKMPILFLSKVKLAHTQGTVQLFGRVRPGMVFIGGNGNVLYQQATNCCVWANYGGKCIFGSKISFCDGVALEIGQHGTLTFNDNIYLGPMVRVACYDSVIILSLIHI